MSLTKEEQSSIDGVRVCTNTVAISHSSLGGQLGGDVDDKQWENSPDSQKVFQRDEGAMTGWGGMSLAYVSGVVFCLLLTLVQNPAVIG